MCDLKGKIKNEMLNSYQTDIQYLSSYITAALFPLICKLASSKLLPSWPQLVKLQLDRCQISDDLFFHKELNLKNRNRP